MAQFIVYERNTGRIVNFGECVETDVPLQANGDPALAVLSPDEDLPFETFQNLDLKFRVVDEQLEALSPEASEPSLEEMKETALAQVDIVAGNIRRAYITTVPGQEMVYLQKRAEAERVIADPGISPDLVPHIRDEAIREGRSLTEQAELILAISDQWIAISAIVEERRLASKAAIKLATTKEEVSAAASANWSDLLPI